MSQRSVPGVLLCPPHLAQGPGEQRAQAGTLGAAGARRWGTLQGAVQMKAQTVCVCFA